MIRHAMQHHRQKSAVESGAPQAAGGAQKIAGAAGLLLLKVRRWLDTAFSRSKALSVRVRPVPSLKPESRPAEMEHAGIRAELESLKARVRGLEDRERPMLPRPGEMSLHLTSKTIALKLARNGQDASQIAKTLGVPTGEVQLLLKVQHVHALMAVRQKEREVEPAERPTEAPRNCAPEAVRSGDREGTRMRLVN
jgi:hypothetical protein